MILHREDNRPPKQSRVNLFQMPTYEPLQGEFLPMPLDSQKCTLWKSTWSHVWRGGELALVWWESKELNSFMWTSTQLKEATYPYPTRQIDCVALCMSTTSALPLSTPLYSLQPSTTRQKIKSFWLYTIPFCTSWYYMATKSHTKQFRVT